MAITHSAFLTQVRNYTEVDSNVLSDTLLDQFIRNVELDIAGQVDYDDLRKYATSNTISGNRYVSMPSDLLILRSVQIISSNIRDFLITVLHEIYHAMDSKKYGKNKFVAMYTQAGQEQEDKGKDFHDDNPFEIAAEKWARREVNKYIKKYK